MMVMSNPPESRLANVLLLGYFDKTAMSVLFSFFILRYSLVVSPSNLSAVFLVAAVWALLSKPKVARIKGLDEDVSIGAVWKFAGHIRR